MAGFQEVDVSKLPSYNYKNIIDSMGAIYMVLSHFVGTIIDVSALGKAATALTSKLEQKGLPTDKFSDDNPLYKAIYASLESMAFGTELTENTAKYIALRMAGNKWLLQNGTPIRACTGFSKKHWAFIVVREGFFAMSAKGFPGARLRFKVITGPMAGEEIEQFVPKGYFTRLAKNCGLLKKYDYRKVEAGQLVGCRIFAELEVDNNDKVRASEFHAKESQVSFNKQLLQGRSKETRKCPNNYEWECHDCHIGYTHCDMATHQFDYERRYCPRCEQFGYFNPADRFQRSCNKCHIIARES